MILTVTFTGVLEWIGYIILALFALMIMVLIHELGHYTAGKLLGFEIKEFAIGFGPAIFKHKFKNGEQFSLRPIPLGGFCSFLGEDEENNNPKAFNNQKPWKRIIVLAAGVLFNFFSAIILVSVFFSCFGDYMPKISTVYQLSGAEQHFQVDDVILEIDGRKVYLNINADLSSYFNLNLQVNEVIVLRNGEKVTLQVQKGNFITEENGVLTEKYGYGISHLVKHDDGNYYYNYERYKFPFFQSIARGFEFSFLVVGKLFSVLGGIITGALGIKNNLGGTLTAIGAISQISRQGFDAWMYAICVMSSTLAVMNILPIPALDGSRIIFVIIEWIRKKPISRKLEGTIHFVGLVLLFSLTIVLDLINYFL